MKLQLFEYERAISETVRKCSVTHMAAPQELRVLDESLLSKLLVEEIIHVCFKTIPELGSHTHTHTRLFQISELVA